MIIVFADTYYFAALLNRQDTAHAAAVGFSTKFTGRIVTGDWILVELADALASTRHRVAVAQYIQRLWLSTKIEVVPCSDRRMRDGLALFENRPDKQWSLTDCISFVVMQERGLTEVLTGDHHFEQAGFKALLKS